MGQMDEKEYLGNQAIELFRQLTESLCWRERPGNKDNANENLSQRAAQISPALGQE